MEKTDEFFMSEALKEAKRAFDKDEVPVGAVIVHEDNIIARAHNQRELLKDPTAHAEMIALTQAASHLDNWRLTGTTIYVTKEPCPMCAGAIMLSRIDKLIFATYDAKGGACGSVLNITNNDKLNHHVEVVTGILESESKSLLQEFFRKKRTDAI
ncbi:MAG: tRNA-specific adenosine deaminase [Planctomycetes bacterium RBG_16_43_13]|nr:MAG: tRNA-specific adenosine deaminase [Planctomycetes bacterium RBG_16_43_13]